MKPYLLFIALPFLLVPLLAYADNELVKTHAPVKLERVIDQAHAKNRRVRFWATPDNPKVWAALRDAGVDLINTDDLQGLSQFLRSSN